MPTTVYIFLMDNLESLGRRSRQNLVADKGLRPRAQRALLDPHLPLPVGYRGVDALGKLGPPEFTIKP